MLERERLAIHPDGDQRIATVERRHREPTGVAVTGTTNDLGRYRIETCLTEKAIQPCSEPTGGTDQLSAHGVRDTGERDVAFMSSRSSRSV